MQHVIIQRVTCQLLTSQTGDAMLCVSQPKCSDVTCEYTRTTIMTVVYMNFIVLGFKSTFFIYTTDDMFIISVLLNTLL